ncbi:MAG: LysR family transcriptional regulator [Alphaproteobacteria bacterium]|nr:LysR family transcriptional regulator [Alphaproteobacteria bacterium]
MRALNLDQLASFGAVVELGSFSAAAEKLSLSQPAVSLQIRQLERRLGVALLERVGRRVAPTAAGRNLLPHIGEIDRAVLAALDAVAAQARGVAGRVRLGTGATACIYLLPPVLRALRRCYPALDIVVRTGNTPDMLRALEDNAIDAALVTLPAPGRSFVVETLLDDEIVVAFAQGASPPPSATPAALAELPVVLYEPGGNTRRIIDDWFRRAGFSCKPVMELGNVEAIKQLVAAGLGCGFLSRLAAPPEAIGDIVVRPLAPPLRRQIGLVLRRDKVPDRGLKEMIEALRRLAVPAN